jgi:hypothetical protein
LSVPDATGLAKDIHARLMKGVRGEVATPGKVRRSRKGSAPPVAPSSISAWTKIAMTAE